MVFAVQIDGRVVGLSYVRGERTAQTPFEGRVMASVHNKARRLPLASEMGRSV